MDIREIEIFIKVAELRNFTQAAKELGYSQSNISARIRQLEDECGEPLFDRIGKNVSLTQYGQNLVPYARRMLELSIEMDNLLKSPQSLKGTVRVGLTESVLSALGENTFLEYKSKYPNIMVDLTVDTTEIIKERMEQGRIDIACVHDEPACDPKWQTLYSKKAQIKVVAAKDNPLAKLQKERGLKISDLQKQSFVLMEENCPYVIRFNQILAANKVTIERYIQLQSTKYASKMVEKASLMSLLPTYALGEELRSGSLVVLDIPEISIPQEIRIILHRDKVLTPQMKGICEEIQRTLEQ